MEREWGKLGIYFPIDISKKEDSESSSSIRERIKTARQIQLDRFDGSKIRTNSQMDNRTMKVFCQLDAECDTLLKNAIDRMGMSVRSHTKILKVARTIADLENSEYIQAQHIAEAISYRTLDRDYWLKY